MSSRTILAALTACAIALAAGALTGTPALAKTAAAKAAPEYKPLICGVLPFMCKKVGKHWVLK